METAVREGQRTIEHAENLMQTYFDMQLDTTRIPALVETLRGSNTCVVPTLVVFGYVVRHAEEYPNLARLMARPELRHVRPELRAGWAPDRNTYVQMAKKSGLDVSALAALLRRQLGFLEAITRGLHEGGIPLIAGSDAGIPFTLPGYSLVEELQLLRDAGLTPYEALRAATRTAAECMDKADEFGSITPGLRADLVLLEHNPLADIMAVEQPAGVVLRGRWLPNGELRRLLAETAGDKE